ncbi:MAG: glycoside hydrolase family 3 N-terminal domain-containing protein [Chitinophagaceae bacterium]
MKQRMYFPLVIFFTAGIFLFSIRALNAQIKQRRARDWADSVFRTLQPEEKIAQLMIVRAHSNLGAKHVQSVEALIKQYNVGGLCFFQGGPFRQAVLTNRYQQLAKTPLLVTIDGEWGLGMRLDSVKNLPRQLMLGALPDAALVYRYGQVVAAQCKRMGIHVNYAPVVDVNNNPNNPVINDRAFGEDKYKVATFGIQYMSGMEDAGVMACAKHFPGHGDTETDSHYDLPVIQKTRAQLDALELYPFQELFKAQVGSVMIGHLYIPSIDNTRNLATSLSKNNVTNLLREEMKYEGIAFTDALEMQGVKKFFPGGKAAVQALIAGNDLLCLPEDVPAAIAQVKKAIRKRKLSWKDIDAKVKRVLEAKYHYGLSEQAPVATENLVADLNRYTEALHRDIALQAITLAANDQQHLPLSPATFQFVAQNSKSPQRIAYVAMGIASDNAIIQRMRKELNADVYFFSYREDAGRIATLLAQLSKYQQVVVGMHGYSRRPQRNFGLSTPAIDFANALLQQPGSILMLFGNPYALQNFCKAGNVLVAYEDDAIIQAAAFDVLTGKVLPLGKLPVSVCERFPSGTGLSYRSLLPQRAFDLNQQQATHVASIDSIMQDAIAKQAFPGAVVMAVKDGNIVFEKSYGNTRYDQAQPMQKHMVFDMASVTKICATTVAVMKLFEAGKIRLDAKLGDYLPWLQQSDKAALRIDDVLLHQAGLKAWIPFFRETIDTATGIPKPGYFSKVRNENYTVRVADEMYMRAEWVDTMYRRMLQSELGAQGKYVYSDNDFIFLGKIVEQLTGKPLDEYVRKEVYEPLGLTVTGFQPRNHIPLNQIVPTESEKLFRLQQLHGDVHDPGAAMFGGIAGHAGLFSNAYEMAVMMQMLCNGGGIGDIRLLKPETVKLFTQYGSAISRRGLGFDKPEKNNASRAEPYPCISASADAFGHTGYTGTGVWADPKHGLVFVFLSNRVYPEGGTNTKLLQMNVRGKVHALLYQAFTDAK